MVLSLIEVVYRTNLCCNPERDIHLPDLDMPMMTLSPNEQTRTMRLRYKRKEFGTLSFFLALCNIVSEWLIPIATIYDVH